MSAKISLLWHIYSIIIYIIFIIYFTLWNKFEEISSWLLRKKVGQLAHRNLVLSALHTLLHAIQPPGNLNGRRSGLKVENLPGASQDSDCQWTLVFMTENEAQRRESAHEESGSQFTENQSVKKQFSKNIHSAHRWWKSVHQRSSDRFQESCQAHILNQILDTLLLLFPSKGKQVLLKDQSRGKGHGHHTADLCKITPATGKSAF